MRKISPLCLRAAITVTTRNLIYRNYADIWARLSKIYNINLGGVHIKLWDWASPVKVWPVARHHRPPNQMSSTFLVPACSCARCCRRSRARRRGATSSSTRGREARCRRHTASCSTRPRTLSRGSRASVGVGSASSSARRRRCSTAPTTSTASRIAASSAGGCSSRGAAASYVAFFRLLEQQFLKYEASLPMDLRVRGLVSAKFGYDGSKLPWDPAMEVS